MIGEHVDNRLRGDDPTGNMDAAVKQECEDETRNSINLLGTITTKNSVSSCIKATNRQYRAGRDINISWLSPEKAITDPRQPAKRGSYINSGPGIKPPFSSCSRSRS